MTTLLAVLKGEVLDRLQADGDLEGYGDENLELDNIRDTHLTRVDRDRAPAIHILWGDANKRDEDKACRWDWTVELKVRVFTRGESATQDDPLVQEVVRRLNPNLTPKYSNGVDLRLLRIDYVFEVADNDAQQVDVVCQAKFMTEPWDLATRATR